MAATLEQYLNKQYIVTSGSALTKYKLKYRKVVEFWCLQVLVGSVIKDEHRTVFVLECMGSCATCFVKVLGIYYNCCPVAVFSIYQGTISQKFSSSFFLVQNIPVQEPIYLLKAEVKWHPELQMTHFCTHGKQCVYIQHYFLFNHHTQNSPHLTITHRERQCKVRSWAQGSYECSLLGIKHLGACSLKFRSTFLSILYTSLGANLSPKSFSEMGHRPLIESDCV